MMKKLLCIILCILSATCFIACKEEKVEENPPMDLMQKTLSDEYEFAMVGQDGTELLTGKDVASLHIVYKKGQNRYLEIRFTEDGVEKFEEAIDDNEKGLIITLDGEVLVSGVIANEETPERAKITGTYEIIMEYFNKMT